MRKTALALTLGLMIGSASTALAANSETVQATFAKFVFKVNGQEKQLATTPLVVDGTSYLPVREVSGLLGYELNYDEATRTISLATKQAERTDQPMQTSLKTNADEWVLLRDLSEQYGVTVTLNKQLTIKKDDVTLLFPIGTDHKNGNDPLVVHSEDNSATIMIKDSQMFISKSSLHILKIDQ